MDHSYKTQKTILLFSWTVAVLFFFVGSLIISENRKTGLPNTNIVIDNETFYNVLETPTANTEETQDTNETKTPIDTSIDSEPDEVSSESDSETVPDTTDAPPAVTPPTIVTPPPPPPKYEIPDYSNFDAVLKESADAGQDYIDKMVFLGDSRTYGLGYYGAVSRNQIWTPSNGTLTLSLVNSVLISYPETNQPMTVKDAVAKKKPEILVISLGINGISFMNEKSFKGTFDMLISNIRTVSPDTKIILQSMYPTAPSYRNWYSINNEKILRGNQWMLETAQNNGVYFLDAYNVLADENGNMSSELHNGDWLHPNAVGYQKVIQYIRTHPILPPQPQQNIVPDETSETTENDIKDTPSESETTQSEETSEQPEEKTSETAGTIQ